MHSKSHFLSLADFSRADLSNLLGLAADIKSNPAGYKGHLSGRIMAMLFEKPSLRTRGTFEIGMVQLGGHALYFGPSEIGLGKREAVKDVAQNLSRWVDVVMARVFAHQSLVELAENGTVPVINGLSDFEHPCQAMGDFLTLSEHIESLESATLAWVGDGNNVVHSLLFGAALLGVTLRIGTPAGYEPDSDVVQKARDLGGQVVLTNDAAEAVAGADAVYTDVWASMGQEEEAAERARLFRPFQVNEGLMSNANSGALFMHCLPAHRGDEVTDGVMDSPESIVFDQAENRLHIQKAIILNLLS
jgi:ornithine carbamoyltransferase